MIIKVLGCATSTGVPIVGCGCEVCTSKNPKNKRTRSSVLVQVKGKNILIDSSTDLRMQALSNNFTKIDAVLYTHSHADHTHGIDDLRVFNFINKTEISCYSNQETIRNIRQNFSYIFDSSNSTASRPKLIFRAVSGEFRYEGIKVIPVDINHAKWIINGYRIGSFAYLTDCSGIPEYSLEKLRDLDLLIIGALRYTPHPAHLSIDQAVEMIDIIKPKRAVFTHMGHEVEYESLNEYLPDNIEPAFDGLEIELENP